MMLEDGHPITTQFDWAVFRRDHSPYLIKEVIDRSECCVPNWFVPLARGMAIASDALLRRVGHRPGMYRPRGWREASPHYFLREIGRDSFLMVRECGETNLWTVERLGEVRRHVDDDDILVHVFGSTPICTRSYPSAMRLAMHCHANDSPNGLRWIKMSPENLELAIETARKRQIDEAVSPPVHS